MILELVPFAFLWVMCSAKNDAYLRHLNRTTLSDIQAYRSLLTLDWLAAEDERQGYVAKKLESDITVPEEDDSDCSMHQRSSAMKVSRVMLELMKSLEGDEGPLIPGILNALVLCQLLFDSGQFDVEPDLNALLKAPKVMSGEPHKTLPRIVSMLWITATEPSYAKENGWCFLKKVTKYLTVTGSPEIASQMRKLQPLLANLRFIMEDFIRKLKPLAPKRKPLPSTLRMKPTTEPSIRRQLENQGRIETLQTLPEQVLRDPPIEVTSQEALHIESHWYSTEKIQLPRRTQPLPTEYSTETSLTQDKKEQTTLWYPKRTLNLNRPDQTPQWDAPGIIPGYPRLVPRPPPLVWPHSDFPLTQKTPETHDTPKFEPIFKTDDHTVIALSNKIRRASASKCFVTTTVLLLLY